jgi:hypothetical protein
VPGRDEPGVVGETARESCCLIRCAAAPPPLPQVGPAFLPGPVDDESDGNADSKGGKRVLGYARSCLGFVSLLKELGGRETRSWRRGRSRRQGRLGGSGDTGGGGQGAEVAVGGAHGVNVLGERAVAVGVGLRHRESDVG